MPSTSAKQARFMAAAAHDPKFASKAGISQSVAKDFNQADKGTDIRKEAEVSEDEAFYPKDWLGAAHYTPSKAESEEPVNKKQSFQEYVDALLGEDMSGMTTSGDIAIVPMGFKVKKKPSPEETAKTGVGLTGARNRPGLGGSNESKYKRSVTRKILMSESVDALVADLTEDSDAAGNTICPKCKQHYSDDACPNCSGKSECTECGMSMGYAAPMEGAAVCPGCKEKKLMDGNQCSSCGGEIGPNDSGTSGMCHACQATEGVESSQCTGCGMDLRPEVRNGMCPECSAIESVTESLIEGETPMSFSNRLERVRSEANLFISNTDAVVKKLRGNARVTMPATLMQEIDAVWTSMVKVLNTLSDVKVFEEPKEESR